MPRLPWWWIWRAPSFLPVVLDVVCATSRPVPVPTARVALVAAVEVTSGAARTSRPEGLVATPLAAAPASLAADGAVLHAAGRPGPGLPVVVQEVPIAPDVRQEGVAVAAPLPSLLDGLGDVAPLVQGVRPAPPVPQVAVPLPSGPLASPPTKIPVQVVGGQMGALLLPLHCVPVHVVGRAAAVRPLRGILVLEEPLAVRPVVTP